MPPATFFETERLRARRFLASDVEAFVAYRADPQVARYQSWSDYTAEQGAAFVAAQSDAEPGSPGTWFQMALETRDGASLVGDLALHVDADDPRQAEIGFTLARAHHGRGYATEAVTGLLDHVFTHHGLHRVVAVTDAENAAAAAVLERVGLRREGHFVENVFFKGAWGSELGFAILEREWAARGG